MDNYEDNDLSPLSYMKVFFRRKELVIIPVFAGLILGICAGIFMPREYKSETVILVQEGKTDNPLFQKIAVSSTVQQRMSGIKESILGWNSLVELVKRLHLDKDVKTKMDFENLIMSLRRNIIIRLRGHNIIHLAYVGKIPEQTQAVVKNITDIFIERNIHIQDQETSDAIKFIEAQLRVYEGKIKSAEIAQLQDRLDTYLIDSTEKHPVVRQLREQIQAKKDELKKKNLEYTKDIRLGVQTTNPIINEIKRALDDIEGSDKKSTASEASKKDAMDPVNLTVVATVDTVLARDVQVNENIYNMLLQRLETAKITQRLQSSKEGTRYTVLDPPRIPLRPFKPNKVLIAFIGLFFGLISGVGLVIAAEFFDKSFLDVEEAKNFLGMPLLGAISKINTIDSIRRERERQRWIYTITAVAGIFVVVITITVANLMK